jgi:hypothetical protein
VYTTLVEYLLRHAEFPDDYASMNETDLKDFRNFRSVLPSPFLPPLALFLSLCSYGVQDTLVDACTVLGVVPLLRQLFAALSMRLTEFEQTAGRTGWRHIESALYAYVPTATGVPGGGLMSGWHPGSGVCRSWWRPRRTKCCRNCCPS